MTFAVLFKYLPNTNIYWRDVWLGALLTALVWEVAKRLLALYIEHSPYAGAYGVGGTVLVLMAWIYVSSLVLFMGAEFTEVYTRRYGSRAVAPAPALEAVTPVPGAPTPVASAASGMIVAATGAGLVIGAVGGAIATTAALLIGARWAKETPPNSSSLPVSTHRR